MRGRSGNRLSGVALKYVVSQLADDEVGAA